MKNKSMHVEDHEFVERRRTLNFLMNMNVCSFEDEDEADDDDDDDGDDADDNDIEWTQ